MSHLVIVQSLVFSVLSADIIAVVRLCTLHNAR